MMMYVVISVCSGILFGIMDAVINANPLAVKLLAVYKPIARDRMNMPLALGIDLLYGFLMAGIFILIGGSLPGGTGVMNGLLYGVMIWFFRVVMYGLSQWTMFKVKAPTLVYMLAAGLLEMEVIGLLYGFTLSGVKL